MRVTRLKCQILLIKPFVLPRSRCRCRRGLLKVTAGCRELMLWKLVPC